MTWKEREEHREGMKQVTARKLGEIQEEEKERKKGNETKKGGKNIEKGRSRWRRQGGNKNNRDKGRKKKRQGEEE